MLPHRPDLPPLPVPPEASGVVGSWRSWVGLVVGGVVGFVLAGSVDLFGGHDPSAWGIAAMVLGVPLVLAVHELGHVVGGQLAGFRFVLLVVGPLRVEGGPDGLRWGLNRSLALAGGLALNVPTDTSDLRRRMAIVTAGGPVASLLLGAVGLAVSAVSEGDVMAVARLIGVTSFAIAAVTLWPGRTGAFLTDGARLLRLLRPGPVADREAAVLGVMAEAMSGTLPRDWDVHVLDQALALRDGDAMEEAAHAFATARAFDLGDAEAARRHLERRIELWSQLPESMRGNMVTEATLFEATARGDAERARAWLDRLPRRALLADDGMTALAHVAIARAAGDAGAARAHAETVREASGGALGEVSPVGAWLDRLEATRTEADDR